MFAQWLDDLIETSVGTDTTDQTEWLWHLSSYTTFAFAVLRPMMI